MKKNFVAKVVVGHRVTIPKEVCQVLQIREGDLVDVDVARIRHESEEDPKREGGMK